MSGEHEAHPVLLFAVSPAILPGGAGVYRNFGRPERPPEPDIMDLLDDLGNHAGADGAATFADGEAQAFV
ncbi:hypothetical protein, partial [Pseudoxanthomonas indica]|uniref:hypothetical protein n=1 Tax=Pseudoxanthomonas indica TaxID=428993 RepID=UPI003CE4EBDA